MWFRKKRLEIEKPGFPEVEAIKQQIQDLANVMKEVETIPTLPTNAEKLSELPELKLPTSEAKEEKQKRPVFIKMEQFNQLTLSLELAKTQLKELNDLAQKLNLLRLEEAKALEAWSSGVEQLKLKLKALEQALSETE